MKAQEQRSPPYPRARKCFGQHFLEHARPWHLLPLARAFWTAFLRRLVRRGLRGACAW